MSYVGIDIIEIPRIEQAISRWKNRFLKRVYTDREMEICCGRVSSLAARFAGKEALLKTLGVSSYGIGWQEMEILSDHEGKPVVHLHGKARKQAERLGLSNIAISLSHSKEYAIALAVGEAK